MIIFLQSVRGLSQIIFPTVSVIMTLRGGGGSEGVTLIFYLKHTLTFVAVTSDVNFNHFQLHAQKLTLKFFIKTVLTSVKADLDLLA